MRNYPLVASARYCVDIGEHAFIPRKFYGAAELLIKDGVVSPAALIEPACPQACDLELAHTKDWVSKVTECRLTPSEIAKSELPVDSAVSLAHRLACSGTIAACRLALETGLGLHAGGGGHHAFADHGEGFCLLNDVAVGIRKMLALGLIRRAAVIDLDAHQGNGTAAIFSGSREVFTFSMHQRDIFPEKKESSSLDIELEAGAGDAGYLAALERALPGVLDSHRPELVVYIAGADCYEHDLLGGLGLTQAGLMRRDGFVAGECLGRKIPMAVVLGGGYAEEPADTVLIHSNTLKTAMKVADALV